jgi:hypothetical protein
MSDLGERIAVGLSRTVSRRSFLERLMRGGLVTGVIVASSLEFMMGTAEAANCSANGVDTVDGWGDQCKTSTPSCGSVGGTCSSGKCSGSTRKRCSFWTVGNSNDGQYCWCSTTGCHSGMKGHYTCCDCWAGGHSGGCGTANGDTACACKQFHQTSTC